MSGGTGYPRTSRAHRFRRLLVVAVLAFAIPSRADAAVNWPWGPVASKADSSSWQVSWEMRYPVVGLALPAIYKPDKIATDDWCYDGFVRGYTNKTCTATYEVDGHSGNDVLPHPDFPVPYGTLPVVAARSGTVVNVGCSPNSSGLGPGYRITMLGNDGRYYRYYHMAKDSLRAGLQTGHSLVAGDYLGLMSGTRNCLVVNNTSLHTHFDAFQYQDDTSPYDTWDPYNSLRSSWSRPGWGTGSSSSQYTAIESAWWAAVNLFGGYPSAVGVVGTPQGKIYGSGSIGSSGVLTLTTSNGTGKVQWLGNGNWSYATAAAQVFDAAGYRRSGAIMQENVMASARWVHGLIWKRYTAMSESSSFLGWPRSGEFADPLNGNRTRQDFEYGCIAKSTAPPPPDGNSYVAAYFGTYPCLVPVGG